MKYIPLLYLFLSFCYCNNFENENSEAIFEGQIDLSWEIIESTQIEFKLKYNPNFFGPKKWIGLGISPTGGMIESDILFIFQDFEKKEDFNDTLKKNNYFVLKDCFSFDRQSPTCEEEQNWELISVGGGMAESEWPTITIRRKIQTCDLYDIDFRNDLNYILTAKGKLKEHSTFYYHQDEKEVKIIEFFKNSDNIIWRTDCENSNHSRNRFLILSLILFILCALFFLINKFSSNFKD